MAMAGVLEELHRDHVHFARLLGILEEELDVIHEEGPPDYQLALDVMHYMTQYPDLFHHPREDVVFERMLLRDPSLTGVLGELLRDHKRLAEIGLAFHDTLAGVLEGAIMSREELDRRGRDYLKSMRGHMDVEEGEVFSLADKLLDDRDWSAVEEAMGRREDPLFGTVVESRYADLFEFLKRSAA